MDQERSKNKPKNKNKRKYNLNKGGSSGQKNLKTESMDIEENKLPEE